MSCRRLGLTVVIVALGCLSRVQAQEPVLLKYKAAKGEALYYKNVMEFKQSQSLLNMKLENVMRQESIVSHIVDEVDAQGQATFKIKAERRKVVADFGAGGKFEYDSKSPQRDSGSAMGLLVTPIYERLTGSEYQVVVGPSGRVVEVKGYAELIGDLVKDNPVAAQFGFGDNKSAQINEQESFVILSDKPVKPGDTWEVPFDLEMPKLGRMRGKNIFTCEGPDQVGNRRTVRIGITGDSSIELAVENAGAKVTGTISTNSFTGTAQFDPQAGRLLSIKRNFSMSGQLSVEAGGMTIAIDNQQDHTSSIELLDKLPE